MSHVTTETQDGKTDYRDLIARIDDMMAALTRERRRLEERASETPRPAETREKHHDR